MKRKDWNKMEQNRQKMCPCSGASFNICQLNDKKRNAKISIEWIMFSIKSFRFPTKLREALRKKASKTSIGWFFNSHLRFLLFSAHLLHWIFSISMFLNVVSPFWVLTKEDSRVKLTLTTTLIPAPAFWNTTNANTTTTTPESKGK